MLYPGQIYTDLVFLGVCLSPAACLNEKNMTHHHHQLQWIYYLMAGRSLMSSCVTPYSFCVCHLLHAS